MRSYTCRELVRSKMLVAMVMFIEAKIRWL